MASHTEEQGPMAQVEHDTLSINESLRLYCGEELVADPVLWTNHHLQLLGCRFSPAQHARLPWRHHASELYINDFLDDHAEKVERIATNLRIKSRTCRLRQVLTYDDYPLVAMSQNLDLHLGDRSKNLPCQLFSLRDEPSIMYMASIDRELVQGLRYLEMEFLEPVQPSALSEAILDLKMKKVTPRNRLHDPYIVALLLAMAREQRKFWGELRYSKNIVAQVLMTDCEDESVHLYAACIPDSFLDKFDSPSVKPTEQKLLLVRHMKVPLAPYETFRRRLYPILLRPETYFKQSGQDVPLRFN
ncbi:hypothetical protein GGI43DRAFT_385223 [Trichoderma evansii]